MNELMVSRARWSLLPLLRPPGPQDGQPGATTSANASPDLSSRHLLSNPVNAAGSGSSGGFRTRMRHMRDKIRRRVAQTGDWPPPGAIFGDRYSVSSGIGAMLAAGRQIPTPGATPGGHWSAPPSRKTYPSQKRNVESFPLKKRSGSDEDKKNKNGAGMSSKKGGIVCSEMDMNAIIAGFREFEKSIRILHHNSGVTGAQGNDNGERRESVQDDKLNSKSQAISAPSIVIDDVDPGCEDELTVGAKMKTRAVSASPAASPKRNQSGKKQVSFDDQNIGERCRSETPLCVHENESSDKERTSLTKETPKFVIPSDSASSMNDLDADETVFNGSQEEEGSHTTVKRKQSPKEVEFDEFGQTWDVYGAEFDPEILGLAIQRRLDHMMEKEIKEVTEIEDQTIEDPQKCERLRRMWRNLWCMTRRQNVEATTSPSLPSNLD